MSTMTLSSITVSPIALSPSASVVEGPERDHRAGEVRLTRRGRLLVLVTALVAMLAVGLLLSTTSAASDSAAGYPTRVVMVGPGDTLWDIADDVAGSGSTREMVSTIQDLNRIAGGGLQAGQRLVVPLR